MYLQQVFSYWNFVLANLSSLLWLNLNKYNLGLIFFLLWFNFTCKINSLKFEMGRPCLVFVTFLLFLYTSWWLIVTMSPERSAEINMLFVVVGLAASLFICIEWKPQFKPTGLQNNNSRVVTNFRNHEHILEAGISSSEFYYK